MPFTQPPLPYKMDALAPHISAETLDFHYNKHHATYVSKLNGFVANTPLDSTTLDAIVKTPAAQLPPGVFNNAAQTWNHTFYWNSLAPPGPGVGGEPSAGPLKDLIVKSFGSFEDFKKKFTDVAVSHFASGWAWLVFEKSSGMLKVVDTHDAQTPLQNPDLKPLITLDVWEHAYYIDFRNARPKYVETWWKLVNWSFAEANLKAAQTSA